MTIPLTICRPQTPITIADHETIEHLIGALEAVADMERRIQSLMADGWTKDELRQVLGQP